MTVMATAVGASTLAHGLHYAIVLVGLWGLASLLLPHALGPLTGSGPRDPHQARVHALRQALACGAPGVPVAAPPADPSAARRTDPTAAWALPLALLGAASAGGIHAAVAPSHLREQLLVGGFLLAAGTAQAAWAALLLLRPGRRLLAVGAAGQVLLLALWLTSRTVGLPLAQQLGLPAGPHPVGGWDVACAAWQAAGVAGCVAALRAGTTSAVPGWSSWHPATRAALGGAVVSAALLTLTGAPA